MTRRELLVGLGLGRAYPKAAPHDYILVAGQISANETELAEGYFAIAQRTAIMVVPESPAYLRLRELRGQNVELIARVL